MNPYKQTKEFHQIFHPSSNQKPTAFSAEEASQRGNFIVEEIVEFLSGASGNDHQQFANLVTQLKSSIDQSAEKIREKKSPIQEPLVEQVDALLDTLYFTYGSFVLMGVDPTELFSIVHQANMGKLFPDGKVHYHPITGKVMKPANWEEAFAPETKIKNQLLKQQEKATRKI